MIFVVDFPKEAESIYEGIEYDAVSLTSLAEYVQFSKLVPPKIEKRIRKILEKYEYEKEQKCKTCKCYGSNYCYECFDNSHYYKKGVENN